MAKERGKKMCEPKNESKQIWHNLATGNYTEQKSKKKNTRLPEAEPMTFTEKVFYLKMCWLRSLSHLQIILTTLNLGMTTAVFMKLYGFDNLKILVITMIILTIAMIVFGHIDVKKGWMKVETSLANRNNPELMGIKSKVEK